MNPRNVWPAVILALGAMTLAGAMAIWHVDKEIILLIVAALVTPVLAALLAAQLGQQQGQLAQLQQQSNGHQSDLVQLVRDTHQLVAQLVPPAASTTPPAPSTDPPSGGQPPG